MRSGRFLAAALAVAALVAVAPLDAQSARHDRRGGQARFGAAQVNVVDGEVLIVRPNGDRFQAVAGDEVFPGDRIVTGPRARAEVQLSRANLVRLGTRSELAIEGLGNRAYRLDLISGALHYSQLRTGNADVDIETGGASIQPIKPGVFSVEADPAGRVNVTVRKGAVEVFSDRGVEKLKKGKSLTIRSRRDETTLRASKAEPRDAMDNWSKRRNKMLEPPPYNRGLWTPGWGWGPYWGPAFWYGGWWGYW